MYLTVFIASSTCTFNASFSSLKATTEKITLKTANEGEVEGGDEVQTNVTEDWISIDEL